MRKKNSFPSHKALFSSLAVLSVVGMALGAPAQTHTQTVDQCPNKAINSTTAIKTYHLRDLTDGFSIVPTKDGGYLLSGDTLAASGMAVPYPFIVKTDAKGAVAWTRQLSSQSLPPRDSSTSHEPHVAAETTDGGFITATDIVDFVDANYETNLKEVGDILVSKLNSKGAQLWSVMLGDYSVDRPQKIWATSDGGVMLLARFADTDHEPDVADIDAVVKHSVLLKIDKNGKVASAKKLDWEAVDMQRLDDGSYVALANIVVPQTGSETAMGDMPTIIKMNSDLSTAWAKSMEMIPSEFNTPTVTNGVLTPGKTTIRIMAGDLKAVQQTPDGGFLALGFYNLLLTQGLSGGAIAPVGSYTPRPLVAVKFDAGGHYQWAKKLTANLVSSITANDLQMIKTADGNFVIMQDVIRDSAGIEEKYQAAAQNADAMKAWAEALAANIELVKIDPDADPIWVKQIDTERELSGFNLAPTADQGVAVAGSMLTTKQHKVISGMEPYKEAALIKLDANGAATNCAGVTDRDEAVVEDVSQYLVSQTMSAGAANDVALNINKKVAEKVLSYKNTARDICQYKKITVTPTCSAPAGAQTNTPVSNQPATAKSWALINYENTVEVAVDGEKNLAVHAELLPILKQVFGDQVKVKDNMKSIWLTYIFPRLVTRADVEAVQKKFEALGYKTDDSEGGVLNVSRVGLTLHMTFSITSSLLGKVEVLF